MSLGLGAWAWGPGPRAWGLVVSGWSLRVDPGDELCYACEVVRGQRRRIGLFDLSVSPGMTQYPARCRRVDPCDYLAAIERRARLGRRFLSGKAQRGAQERHERGRTAFHHLEQRFRFSA